MRHLSLALALCLPAALSHAAESHDHRHASLPAHQHGSAELDAALEDGLLELELRSPAVNLLGFEHRARSPADQRTLAAARTRLEQPDALFGLPAEAACRLEKVDMQSALFDDTQTDLEHSDIVARYRYACSEPAALRGFALDGLFRSFPGIESARVQLISPDGQQGIQASPANAQVSF